MTAAASAGDFDASVTVATAPDLPWHSGATDTEARSGQESAERLAPWPMGVTRRVAVSDAATLALSGVVALMIWSMHAPSLDAAARSGATVLLGSLAVGWFSALGLLRTRHAAVLGRGSREFARLTSATVAAFGALAVVALVVGIPMDRLLLLPALATGLGGLVGTRLFWRGWIRGRRRHGECVTTVLAVGGRGPVSDLAVALRGPQVTGYRIIGVCTDGDRPAIRLVADREGGQDPTDPLESIPVLGATDQVSEMAKRLGVGAVVVTDGSGLDPADIKGLSRDLQAAGIGVVHVPAMIDVAPGRIETEHVAGLPLMHVAPPTFQAAGGWIKRAMDAIGSSLLILLLSPVLAAIALAVKLSGSGPVFFRQERIGLAGRPFRMIKFRSMVCGAEDRLAEIRAQQDLGNAVMFKMKDDPRITRVGRVLRRLSLDELPQLFNVWKSEMSLVGPRPALPSEVESYSEDDRRRFLVKPGMTGLWQVSGRSELSWSETVRLDQYYVDNWSPAADMAILCRTFKAASTGS